MTDMRRHKQIALNLEKMNIGRAGLVFFLPLTAALQYLHENSEICLKVQPFQKVKVTITFFKEKKFKNAFPHITLATEQNTKF